MPSGKKGKKKNCKTVDLMSFLADGGGTPSIPLKSTSWADDVEEEHGYMSRSSKEPVVLPTAPRAARDEENIPANPPYVAYISNLPYDVDEDDLADFFRDMKITNMRLPKDSLKLRGYGYVEFEDRQSLVDALSMTNTTIKTRRVRIEVSNSSNDDRRSGRMGRDNRRDAYDDPERTSGDWRSGPREEAVHSDGDSFRSRYDNRDRKDRDGAEYDNKPGAWRDRDVSDEKSSLKTMTGYKGREKEWSRFGERSSRDDREGGFGPRRYGDRESSSSSDWDRNKPKPAEKSEPRSRPKLVLQPRTKPVTPGAAKEETSEESVSTTSAKSSAAIIPSANIFGAAKPVDTAAREREIEERLAKSYAESKAKEEGETDKRAKEPWGRRNGEGRDDKEKERPTWRSEEDKGRKMEKPAPRNSISGRSEQHGDVKSPPIPTRGGQNQKAGQKSSDIRGPNEKEKKEKDRETDRDDISKMPKAKEEQAPNFVASNKYSILPDDVDPDDIDIDD